jgi:hypothetical protein
MNNFAVFCPQSQPFKMLSSTMQHCYTSSRWGRRAIQRLLQARLCRCPSRSGDVEAVLQHVA